jgi:hypothetical protein
LSAFIPVFFQQHVEQFRPISEIGVLQLIQRIHQIDQAAFRGQIENTQRSSNFEPFIKSNGRTFTVIDEMRSALRARPSDMADLSPGSSPARASSSISAAVITSNQPGA